MLLGIEAAGLAAEGTWHLHNRRFPPSCLPGNAAAKSETRKPWEPAVTRPPPPLPGQKESEWGGRGEGSQQPTSVPSQAALLERLQLQAWVLIRKGKAEAPGRRDRGQTTWVLQDPGTQREQLLPQEAVSPYPPQCIMGNSLPLW